MNFKRIYLTFIIFSIFGIFFIFFINQPLFYYLYGFSPNVINDYSAESFKANAVTFLARRLSSFVVWATITICLILSCYAVYKRIFMRYFFSPIILVLTLLLFLFYLLAFILSLITPTSMLG